MRETIHLLDGRAAGARKRGMRQRLANWLAANAKRLALREANRYGADEALADLKNAERYFETVCEPELVDFAVYRIEAARRRYAYYLREAKTRRG